MRNEAHTLSRRAFVGGIAGAVAAAATARLSAAGPAQNNAAADFVDAGTVLSQVRLRGRPGLWNVALQGATIKQITQAPIPGSHVIACEGRLLTEGLVEHHIHLDKALTADRVKWDEASLAADRARYEEEFKAGRFLRFFTIYRESLIKHTFTEQDVFERAVRMARMVSASGTTAIRSHAVVEEVRGLNCVTGLLRAREAIKPYMDLQIVLHPQDGNMRVQPAIVELMRKALALGADGVGGLPELDWANVDEYLELVFRLAADHGAFVDMHTDQGGAARANPQLFSHPLIVAKTRKYGMQGRVTASHSHSLGTQPREKVLPVLDEMRETGVHLACAPSGFLEERIDVPRSRGVLVSIMNDNVRDTLIRGGSGSLIEAANTYVRARGIGTDERLDATFDLITTCPGRALGIEGYGLREGGRADLVLFDATSPADVLLYEAQPALVIKGGKLVAQNGRALW